MKATTKTKIELSLDELKQLIRDHFGAKPTDQVYLKLGVMGDDRFGTAPQACVGATIEIDVDSKLLLQAVRGGNND